MDRHRDRRRRILAIFDAQAQVFAQPGFRGCAFVPVLAEAPLGGQVAQFGGQVAQSAGEFRAWIRELFTRVAEQVGAPDPPELARQLNLI